jgi:hypothetical protein
MFNKAQQQPGTAGRKKDISIVDKYAGDSTYGFQLVEVPTARLKISFLQALRELYV